MFELPVEFTHDKTCPNPARASIEVSLERYVMSYKAPLSMEKVAIAVVLNVILISNGITY